MTRVKRGTTSLKRRKNVLKQAKGYQFGRSKKEKQAKEAIRHAGVHAFTSRRDKKNDFRKLWSVKISAGLRPFDLSYSKFIGLLKKKDILLNRKMLAEIAETTPEVFGHIIEKTK